MNSNAFVIDDPVNTDSEDEGQDLVFHDMQLFFHAIGEPQLIDLFMKHKVNLGTLLEMDEQDLINCGVELVGDRKKILANTGQMHCEKWQPSSLQDLTTKSLLSSPGIYISLNDINKHIEYVGATLKYLKRRIQSDPEILELGKDFVGVMKINSELEDLLKTSNATHDNIRALQKVIHKHTKDPLLHPANHIDKRYVRKAHITRLVVPMFFATLTICFSLRYTLKMLS